MRLGTIRLIVAACLPIAMIACGMGAPGTGDTNNPVYNGIGNGAAGTPMCSTCHSTPTTNPPPSGIPHYYELLTGSPIVAAWNAGRHGNANNNPNYALSYYSTSCNQCHDSLGEGQLISAYNSVTGSLIGTTNRPIVGCESCHGASASHAALGDTSNSNSPIARPDSSACAGCHDTEVSHHTGTGNIVTQYFGSNHAHSLQMPIYNTYGNPASGVKAVCSKCHTDEGAKTFTNIPASSGTLNADFTGKTGIAGATPVQCRTCHKPHDVSSFLKGASATADGSESSQYRLCTSCHETANALHGASSPYSWSGGAVGVGNFNGAEIIYDTHFDNASTADIIEGYVINSAASDACSACHDVHSLDLTPNHQWAASAHGGHIIDAALAIDVAQVTVENAVGYLEFDFKGTDRMACQRCHTSTGFVNLARDKSSYDPANNVFAANTVGIYNSTTSSAREMTYCWACHTSAKGTLRNPGVFNAIASYNTTAPYNTSSSVINRVPDASGSNICIACHSGRATGDDIKKKAADYATMITNNNFSKFSAHVRLAGGILYRTIGYEFAGENYSNPIGYMHDQIGMSDTMGTGTNGPCVACHMENAEPHLFNAVTADSGGAVTAVPSFGAVCVKCHSGMTESSMVTLLNDKKDGFDAAIAAAYSQLEIHNGIYHGSGYPYYFNAGAQIVPNAYKTWRTEEELGAAFNINTLEQDPGAYAHNSLYTKLLLYDTIDYIDDATLNQSVAATLGSSSAAYLYLKPAEAYRP